MYNNEFGFSAGLLLQRIISFCTFPVSYLGCRASGAKRKLVIGKKAEWFTVHGSRFTVHGCSQYLVITDDYSLREGRSLPSVNFHLSKPRREWDKTA